MSYLSSSTIPVVRENPSSYSPFSRNNVVYEVSLRITPPASWLQDLSNAHQISLGLNDCRQRGSLHDFHGKFS